MKKLLSAILVIAMLCSTFASLAAFAYTEIHIPATDFSLTEGEYGDTSPNGFDQTWYLKKYYPVEVYSGNYGTFVEMLSSEWLTYRVNVETAGTYTLAMDAATSAKTGITVTVNGQDYSVSLPSTSGVLNFTDLTNLVSFPLTQGVNEIIVKNSSGNYFNYRELMLSSSVGSGTESDYQEEETITWWGKADWEAGFNGYSGTFTATDFTGTYSGDSANIGTGSFMMEPGDFGTYTFNAPYTGVYAMQLFLSDLPEGTGVIRAVSGDYYAEFFMEYPGWSNIPDNLQDQPMYFTQGNNTVVITNVGDAAFTVTDYDFGRLDAIGYDSMDFMPLVRKVSDMPAEGPTATFSPTPTPGPTTEPTATPTVKPTATPTAKPTATPTAKPTATPTPTVAPTAKPLITPAPTATPTRIYVYDAPYAGVYSIGSTTSITTTAETGSYASTGFLNSKVIYLLKGENKLSLNKTGSVKPTITKQSSDNGMTKFSSVKTSFIPYSHDHTYFGDRDGIGIHGYVVGGSGTFSMLTDATGQYVELAPGASVNLQSIVSQYGEGIVYPYLNVCDNKTHTFTISSDTGFYAELNKYKSDWQTTCWADTNEQDMEFLFMREGENVVTVENTGSNTARIYGLRMSMTDGSDGIANHATWGSQINLENLKVVDQNSPTPTLSPDFVAPEAGAVPTATPTPTVKPTATPTPTVKPTATPTATPKPTATPTPTAKPTATPTPTVKPTATPVPTVAPTATPTPINPEVNDGDMRTVYEGESFKSGSVTKASYNGASTAKATSESTATYEVTVEEDTVYNLYMKGAAWKDVSFDILIDGTVYSYETAHFQSDRNETYSYKEECVATFPLTKGTHTIGFTFYCDTYYFDSFTLEDTYSKQYQILYGIKDISTSQGIYEALLSAGDYINVDVAADTAQLACPQMAFWGMVGKNYTTPAELKALYESVLADELADPTVKLRNASNISVAELPAGKSTVTVNCADIPKNTSLVCAIYKGDKLAMLPQVAQSNSTTVSFSLSDVEAGCELKILALTDMEEMKPYTSSGTYMDYYVATNGKSTNDGLSPDTPLATVSQALTKVKAVNSQMTGDIIIHVAPGVYRSNVTIEIDPTMSGMNGYKVIIQGDDPDNRPIFSGGEPLTGKWSKVSGENYWVASTSTRETRALYVNGYQAVLARSEETYSGGYITPTSPKNEYHTADGIKVSLSSYPNISRDLGGETRMHIVFNLAWANQRFPVDSITYDSSYAYVNTTYPYYNAFLMDGHTSTVQPLKNRAFYLENAMALLDKPGEFYFDKSARKIYYYPYANEDMTTAETYCAVTDGLMTVQGTSSTNRVENLEFKDVSFRYGAWDDATTYGAAFNQTDEIRRGTDTGYSQHLMHSQILVSYADGLVFDGCEFADLGSSAMYMTEGVTNSKVVNCDFHDLSGGGISVSNYLHNSNYNGIARCQNIEIGNNIFRRVSQEFLNLPAVAVYYANSINVHHNDIKDMPYSAICIGWGWGYYEPNDTGNHIVAYNKITNVCKVLDDGAQIYTLGDQKNMHLNDNYLIDPGNYRRGGVYFDEGTGYISMTDNVVENADDSGDFWLFARKYVNLNDNYAAYNHTDGGNPKNFATFPLDTSGVEYGTNYINQTSWKTTAQRIMAEAGVEDKSRVADVNAYPVWRTLPMLNLPADAVID